MGKFVTCSLLVQDDKMEEKLKKQGWENIPSAFEAMHSNVKLCKSIPLSEMFQIETDISNVRLFVFKFPANEIQKLSKIIQNLPFRDSSLLYEGEHANILGGIVKRGNQIAEEHTTYTGIAERYHFYKIRPDGSEVIDYDRCFQLVGENLEEIFRELDIPQPRNLICYSPN